MKRFLAGLLLVILSSACIPLPTAHAAPPEGIEVKPLRNYPALDRGTTGTGSLALTNNTPMPQNISMDVETFAVNGEDYDYTFGTSDEVDWIVFNEPTFVLQPKQTKTITYSIAVPGDAAAGGHYFSLLTVIDPPKDTEGVTEIRRIASLLYLEVSGSITKKSNLVSVSLPWFTSKQNVPIQASLSNNGTSHSRARVLIMGQSWATLLIRQPKTQYALLEGTIMPSTVRKLTGQVDLPKTPGIYHVVAEYAPNQGGLVKINKTIIYAPVWFIILIFITLIGLVIAIIRFARPVIKKRSRKSAKD